MVASGAIHFQLHGDETDGVLYVHACLFSCSVLVVLWHLDMHFGIIASCLVDGICICCSIHCVQDRAPSERRCERPKASFKWFRLFSIFSMPGDSLFGKELLHSNQVRMYDILGLVCAVWCERVSLVQRLPQAVHLSPWNPPRRPACR